jgi:hypothetical protein
MQYVYFFVIAIAAYFGTEWVIDRIERQRGERFEYRQVYFLFLLMAIVIGAFEVIGRLVG